MTTMTHNQLAWRQFSERRTERTTGYTEQSHDDAQDHSEIRAERFDLTVPNTSKTTSKTTAHHQSMKRVQWSKPVLTRANSPSPPPPLTAGITAAAATASTATTATTATAQARVEIPKKAKTRAARRAEDPDFEPGVEVVEEPAARKEMRSNYWVRRDDIRRDDARTMKNQFQELRE